jgi:hypothetical protein
VDNIAVQVLQAWPINTDFFDGVGQVTGPVCGGRGDSPHNSGRQERCLRSGPEHIHEKVKKKQAQNTYDTIQNTNVQKFYKVIMKHGTGTVVREAHD